MLLDGPPEEDARTPTIIGVGLIVVGVLTLFALRLQCFSMLVGSGCLVGGLYLLVRGAGKKVGEALLEVGADEVRFREAKIELLGAEPGRVGGTVRVKVVLEPEAPVEIFLGDVYSECERIYFRWEHSTNGLPKRVTVRETIATQSTPFDLPSTLAGRHELVLEVKISDDALPSYPTPGDAIVNRIVLRVTFADRENLIRRREVAIVPQYAEEQAQ